MRIFSVSLIFLVSLLLEPIYSQPSCSPSDGKSNLNNKITFHKNSSIVEFQYKDSISEFSYQFDFKKGGYLGAIQILDDKNGSFYPSNGGGVNITSNSKEYYSWNPEIKYQLISSAIYEDSVVTKWLMSTGNISFKYQMSLRFLYKTLAIKFEELENNSGAVCSSVHLDRCENSISPLIIGIPYLTNFNLLFSNNNFVSLFFDWENTNCSTFLPYNSIYSPTSVYFSQLCNYFPATNGVRNELKETIYLTYSESLDEILPNIPKGNSEYKNVSSARIIFDYMKPFNLCKNDLQALLNSGLKNIWVLIHDWQRAGYDNELPFTFPANSKYGGSEKMIELSNFCRENDILIGLHENYTDFYPNYSKFEEKDVAKKSDFKKINAWDNGNVQSYLLKPTQIEKYLIPISTEIHDSYNTNSSYIDVLSSYDPSKYVDYESTSKGAAKYSEVLNNNRNAAQLLRDIHKGPVSGEGLAHFLYAGYYDDFCAQIHTAQNYPPLEKTGGYYRPLLLNFELLKIHEKTSSHGVGYYERFFYKDQYWKYNGKSRDSALMYTATELAYGHCSFVSSNSYNFIEQAQIEYKYLYPFQESIANSKIISILYYDGNSMLTISDYIRKHPYDFENPESHNFLSKVKITYDNGMIIFVNRNNFSDWNIETDFSEAMVSYHSKNDSLFVGIKQIKNITLPSKSGWLIYKPN